jgi:hypothetical protein
MREVLRAPLRYPDMRAGIKASLEEMRRTVRIEPVLGYPAACDCRSPRCTGSATISSCSMRRAVAGPVRRRTAPARGPPHRHRFRPGAGAAAARAAGTDVYYRIFNADGSEVEQCGNGARCIARLVASRAGRRDRSITMDSPGGRVDARLRADGLVSVAMGVPNFDPRSLPFTTEAEAASYRVDLPAGPVEFGAVDRQPARRDPRALGPRRAVDTVGPAMENHPRFPRRVNVGFVEIVAPDHVRLRVFERGVGETWPAAPARARRRMGAGTARLPRKCASTCRAVG